MDNKIGIFAGEGNPAAILCEIRSLREELDQLASVVPIAIEQAGRELLREHSGLKPLLDLKDLCRTLRVSERTAAKIVATGKLPPLWIRGQRRWHPDVIAGYLRSREGKASPRRRGGAKL